MNASRTIVDAVYGVPRGVLVLFPIAGNQCVISPQLLLI
jgi:hypothetical protein